MGNPQDDFPLRPACILFSPRMGTAVISLLALTASRPANSQQAGDSVAMRLRSNVVKIEVPMRENAENGFGFITGQRDGKLYIVTADHVLRPSNDPNAPPPGAVKVTFFSDQGRSYNAEVLDTHDHRIDLGVIRVKVPSGIDWYKDCLADTGSQNRGTRVWFIGRNSNWFVPVQAGFIDSEHPSDDGQIDVEGLPIRPGSSGGPLVSSTGLVGMIQRGTEDDARALSITRVKTALRDWNYPYDLNDLTGAAVHPPKDLGPSPKNGAPGEQTNCKLSIDSNPSEADVTLDGDYKGKTPIKVDLTPGSDYKLSVAKANFKTYSQKISCSSQDVDANLKPESASITLRYTGDYGGCVLQLAIKIGDKTFNPRSSLYPVSGIQPGVQNYTIQGRIQCALGGWCTASGSGTLEIKDSGLYDVAWMNTGVGACSVTLVNSSR